MLACHAGGPGSIPGRCKFSFCNFTIVADAHSTETLSIKELDLILPPLVPHLNGCGIMTVAYTLEIVLDNLIKIEQPLIILAEPLFSQKSHYMRYVEAQIDVLPLYTFLVVVSNLPHCHPPEVDRARI